jgi:hypothetical protein
MLGTKPRRKYPDPEEVARMINEEYYAEQRKLALERKRRELTGEPEPEEKKPESSVEYNASQLKIVQGPLNKTLPKMKPGTLQHSAQICKLRLTNEELRNSWFWTADSALYMLEDGEPVLYFGGIDTNLIFQNINKAYRQLTTTRNYVPSDADVQKVLAAAKVGSVMRIELSALGLTKLDDTYSYFEICKTLNPAQHAFAERVYGVGHDFVQYLELLNKSKIVSTRVYVLNPTYVKTTLRSVKAIARACWLYYFFNLSDFNAGNCSVNCDNVRVFGVESIWNSVEFQCIVK